MYFPDFNGAGHALSIPVAPAQQHLDLIPRLLLDVAGTAFLVIVLLLVLSLIHISEPTRP